MFFIQAAFWLLLIGILIFLMFSRASKKKKETFEDRDN